MVSFLRVYFVLTGHVLAILAGIFDAEVTCPQGGEPAVGINCIPDVVNCPLQYTCQRYLALGFCCPLEADLEPDPAHMDSLKPNVTSPPTVNATNVECPDNEVFTVCGSACQPTCAERNPAMAKICTKECVSGCFCAPGFVRDHRGHCILADRCSDKKMCPANEVFSTCGSSCPATCQDISSVRRRKCVNVCVPGCFCETGYVRNADGICVITDSCT